MDSICNASPVTVTANVTALVGDVHGHHHQMVSMLQAIEKKRKVSIVRVLQVGDFEAHRHEQDVSTMDAPQRYRKLGDFPVYHQGKMHFPWPLYFVGGNHEPYGWYEQHLTGAYLAENCYYMGRVGLLELEPYRVVGLTGIFHPEHFYLQRPSVTDIGTVPNKNYGYYTRQDVDHVMTLGKCDILMLHDWPKGIINPSDYPAFLQRRRSSPPEEIGNEFTFDIIKKLQPTVVVCGHLHYKYRNTLNINEAKVEVCCVANITSGSDAVILLDESLNVIE